MMILLSGPRLAASMSWAAQYAAFGPYLENLLPSYVVQLTQFIGPLTGMLISPVVGHLTDECTSSFGRRRPFLVVGALSSIICWIFFGFTRELGEAMGDEGANRRATGYLAMFFYTWMSINVNVFATPAHLILADFAGDRQTSAAAIGQAAFVIGGLVVAIYIQTFDNAAQTLHAFVAMLSIVMALAVGLLCIYAQEVPLERTSESESEPYPAMRNPRTKLAQVYLTLWTGIRKMPTQLVILAIVFFCRCYGSTSYHGAKGQYFGIVVYGGNSILADKCEPNCTTAQLKYNEGVSMAGGLTDILYCIFGYVASWIVPCLVAKFGAKFVVTAGMIPQVFLVWLGIFPNGAFALLVAIVVSTSITQAFVDATIVPILLHVLGSHSPKVEDQERQLTRDSDSKNIGIYVGIFNSVDCLGQLLNFGISAYLVTRPLGYAFPMLVGGFVSFLGFLIACIFLRVRLHSL